MGTETRPYYRKHCTRNGGVKLNNPLMGTETVYMYIPYKHLLYKMLN